MESTLADMWSQNMLIKFRSVTSYVTSSLHILCSPIPCGLHLRFCCL